MLKKILLIGKQEVNTTNFSTILDHCDLKDFELIQNPSLESAKSAVNSGDFCLVIINGDKIKRIKRFLLFQRRKKFFIPIILLCESNRAELEMLTSLGACDVIRPDDVNVPILTESILSAIEQKRIETELRSRDTIMRTINYAAEVFLSQSNWDVRINEVLAQFGAATHADKVCIYKNKIDGNEDLISILIGGWSSCDEFPIDEIHADTESRLNGFVFRRWIEKLKHGEFIHGNLLEFPPTEQSRLSRRNIRTLAIIPIFSDQIWWGFITFEHCRSEKKWITNDLEALKTAAKIIGAGISRLDAESRLTYLATHDFLTSLPNRLLLEDRFELAIARANRNDKKFGVVTIDLDKFKLINDSHGHQFGDKVLVEIAWRLSEAIRNSDTCARVGGDEFTVLAEGIKNKRDLLRVMQKLTEAIAPHIVIEGKSVNVTASMGGSIFPNNGVQMEDLMKAADVALYQVKNKYSGYKVASDDQIAFVMEQVI